MNISKLQFDYLQEMGVSLWQSNHKQAPTTHSQEPLSASLLEQPLMQDILLAMGLSSAELKVKNHFIDCHTFNWHFSDKQHCEFQQHQLITPPLDALASSARLKQQLWQLICQEIN
jgi:DNA polymerase III psi subunit